MDHGPKISRSLTVSRGTPKRAYIAATGDSMADASTSGGVTSPNGVFRRPAGVSNPVRPPGGPSRPAALSRPCSVGTQARDAPVRVLVCDDHAVYRLGLRAVLSAVADVALVGECCDPILVWTERLRTCPDVLLLAQRLSEGGLDIIRHFDTDGIGVVVLGESDEQRDLVDALRAGARAYLRRDSTTELLLDAIRAISRHETVLPGATSEHMLKWQATVPPQFTAPAFASPPHLRGLTARQREVARLVADGLSNAEVAAQLYVSQATVKSHLTIILKRLHLRDRTQLAIFINRINQIDEPPPGWT